MSTTTTTTSIKMATAKVIDPLTGKKIEYYIETRLKNSLDNKVIPSLHKKDKDCVMVVDGREGSGKSTLAFQIAKYVDPSFNLGRIVFGPDDFREAVLRAKKGEAIVYDEAFTGFSSRAALSPINRVLVSLAMQMRQKNLLVLIVLPTIFMLDKYMALFRTRVLVHVYENKGIRGYFRLYNTKTKKLLILLGKKTMDYSPKVARTNFKGRFYGKYALGDKLEEDKYRRKKDKALRDSEKTDMNPTQVKHKDQRDKLIHFIKGDKSLTYRQLSNLFETIKVDVSYGGIRLICNKIDAELGLDAKNLAEEEVEAEENAKNTPKL